MSRARPPSADPQWQDTTPLPLRRPRAAPATNPAVAGQPAGAKPQTDPPFEQIAQGLEMREIDSQTVFDQLFGNTPRP